MKNRQSLSVQDQYAKHSICYGCGPANPKGLQIKSYRTDKGLEMSFETKSEHQAFPGVINGGVIGSLFDCHGNWAAAIGLLDSGKHSDLPSTVTASYNVQMLRPTPFGKILEITAVIDSLSTDRAEVSLDLFCEDVLCARGHGLFIAVKKDHPAYHRW
ncbi:MAG: PaaI family thioesterase [Candidatus Neomarinimicrobiota bacterium]|jgi:acyl-coenzyme A thioesterase PaaI-like protein